MKKLIIAVFAVAFAAAAQAATVNWKTSTTGKVYEAGTTTLLATADAYLFDLSANTQSDILSKFAAGESIASKAVTDKKTITNGVIGTGSFEWSKEGMVSCYVAIISGDNIFISSAIETELSAVGTATYQFNLKNDSQAASIGSASEGFSNAGWYTAAVPEPTSGLLLLLGMAGLALKRKVA